LQLLSEICRSKELDKPVRRSEKKILNEMMKCIRYPLKAKVQEPYQKSYVLMQAAVSRADVKEFSLKVEQSEIVESALRVLSALIELSKEKERGEILESSLLLDRALKCRLWETNYGSIFSQCAGKL
jgi:replicative superfamily II helicase